MNQKKILNLSNLIDQTDITILSCIGVMVNSIVVISNFTENRSLEGYIGLQNHDNRYKVFYRNIKVGEIL